MIFLTFLVIMLIATTLLLGVMLFSKKGEWLDVLLASALTVLCALAVIAHAYGLKIQRENPVIHQTASVNWGTVDSTLIIGTNRFEVEVGVHPDGTIQYRKGKQK